MTPRPRRAGVPTPDEGVTGPSHDTAGAISARRTAQRPLKPLLSEVSNLSLGTPEPCRD